MSTNNIYSMIKKEKKIPKVSINIYLLELSRECSRRSKANSNYACDVRVIEVLLYFDIIV